MTQYIKPKDRRASQMMWDAALGGAGTCVCCDCGKDWYDEDAPVPDDDDYVADWDHVMSYRFVEIDNKVFVEECENCQIKLGKYEQWIWDNRDLVRDYLKIRVDQQFKWAEQEKLLNTIAGIK